MNDGPMGLSRRSFLGTIPATGALMAAGWGPAGRRTDRDYLVKGLIGMGRACDRPGWFQAHWGAAVLAAYYLCRDVELPDRVKAVVRAQADLLIAKFSEYFVPFEGETADSKRVEEIAAALEGPITGHRASGHHVIFAALGLRALAEAPELATPSLIRGFVKTTERIAAGKAAPDTEYNRANPLPAFTDEASLADALFTCILRYENAVFDAPGGKGPARPNFTHQITSTESLIQLMRAGRGKLAARGHAAQGIHINEAPARTAAEPVKRHAKARLDVVLSPEFWEDEANHKAWKATFEARSARMGDWVVGHLFKVLYSYLQLRPLVRDAEKVRKVDAIVLERYVDLNASGG